MSLGLSLFALQYACVCVQSVLSLCFSENLECSSLGVIVCLCTSQGGVHLCPSMPWHDCVHECGHSHHLSACPSDSWYCET